MADNIVNTESNTVNSMKVYELAKELGMDSLALVDKLASLNIRVKNHMSDLDGEAVVKAKESLIKSTSKPAASGKVTAKTGAPVRRKAGASPSVGSTADKRIADKKVPEKKATEKKDGLSPSGFGAPAVKRKATPDSISEPVTTQKSESQTESAQSPRTVLRRRTKDGEAVVISGSLPAKSTRAGELSTLEDIQEARNESADENRKALELAQEELREFQEEQQREAAQTQAPADEPSHLESVITESPVATEDTSSTSRPTSPTPRLNFTAPTSPKPIREAVLPGVAPASSPATAMTDRAVQTKSSISSTMTATPAVIAPKRSFLTIVQATPVQKPRIVSQAPASKGGIKPGQGNQAGMRGTTTQDKDGFRTIRMTKENLDQMAEEESARKKLALKGDLDINPEDIRFADYRKKEMVFLPKKKKLPVGKTTKKTEITVAAAHKRVVEMGDRISISEFADQMQVKAIDVVRKLMGMGVMSNVNQSIDFDTACLVAPEFKYEVKNIAFKEDDVLATDESSEENLTGRPPVVTIMGHVDHGKTSLLDAIRSANVAAGEFGGITQHIGAYTVNHNGKPITFIDTPGHEAFTAMRARGANVTDIVVLVVAADDAVMPQTREALSHAKAAGVQIIVAVNKMDKPGANPERVKQQLAELDLLAEDWGGQTMFVPVSALKKTGIPELLEAILLTAEVLDLKADATLRAQGIVLESKMEKGKGPVASVLLKRGKLNVGDLIVSGLSAGKIKAMTDDQGQTIKELTPGFAVEVLGFDTLPVAGDRFDIVDDDRDAAKLVDSRKQALLATKPAAASMSLDALFSKIQAGETKELGVVIKADVSGTVEAVRESLLKLSTPKVKVKILFAAPGGITESDVLLASASKAIIVGFNVRPETSARKLAEAKHIEIKCYNIIYELIDEVRNAMTGVLDKKKVEKFLGRAEIRQTFSVPKIGTIAGCFVIDGKMLRGAEVRLLRDSRIIFEGKLSSLKRFKDDAKEVLEGYECGMSLDGYQDLKVGDLIEAYQIEFVTPELN